MSNLYRPDVGLTSDRRWADVTFTNARGDGACGNGAGKHRWQNFLIIWHYTRNDQQKVTTTRNDVICYIMLYVYGDVTYQTLIIKWTNLKISRLICSNFFLLLLLLLRFARWFFAAPDISVIIIRVNTFYMCSFWCVIVMYNYLHSLYIYI